jgi:hypothetical protein
MLMPNLTSQVWNPRTTFMWGKFGANRGNFFFKFDLWPSMTLNFTKFDLAEMNPSRAIPGSAYTPLPTKDVGEKQMWHLGPNDLDLCRNKPLKGQFQGQPTHPYQVLWNWAQGRGREANVTFGPQRPWPLPKQTLKGQFWGQPTHTYQPSKVCPMPHITQRQNTQ